MGMVHLIWVAWGTKRVRSHESGVWNTESLVLLIILNPAFKKAGFFIRDVEKLRLQGYE